MLQVCQSQSILKPNKRGLTDVMGFLISSLALNIGLLLSKQGKHTCKQTFKHEKERKKIRNNNTGVGVSLGTM